MSTLTIMLSISMLALIMAMATGYPASNYNKFNKRETPAADASSKTTKDEKYKFGFGFAGPFGQFGGGQGGGAFGAFGGYGGGYGGGYHGAAYGGGYGGMGGGFGGMGGGFGGMGGGGFGGYPMYGR